MHQIPLTSTVKTSDSSWVAYQNVQKKLAGLIIPSHVLYKKKNFILQILGHV